MRKQKWLMEDKTKQRNNIWFFGDSFCARHENWVKYISDNYNVKHLGTGGTGIQHTIMDYHLYKHNITPNDKVVVCYNSLPTRILIKFWDTDIHHSFFSDSQVRYKEWEWDKQDYWKRKYSDEEILLFYEKYHDYHTEEVKNIYLVNSLHHLLHQQHNDVLEFFCFVENKELMEDIIKWYDFNKLPSLMDFTSSFYNDHSIWFKENDASPNHFQDFMMDKFKETYEV